METKKMKFGRLEERVGDKRERCFYLSPLRDRDRERHRERFREQNRQKKIFGDLKKNIF